MHMDFKGCFINARWVETKDRFPIISPWSGEAVGGALNMARKG